MMAVWRKHFVFKFDGKLGTIEDTTKKVMKFLNDEQTKLCCKSNVELDKIINLLK